jgi:hypothetical protein
MRPPYIAKAVGQSLILIEKDPHLVDMGLFICNNQLR